MFRVGYTSGLLTDASRRDWDNLAPRPLAWSAWYPTRTTSNGDDRNGEAPAFFDLENVSINGELLEGGQYPVVLTSHGTGGSPESMGWLARRLAERGNVVIGAHHHGNTAREVYRPEGFLCWWERALDISSLLSQLDSQRFFANRLNLDRVSCLGFSLGGYTALALAGARGSMDNYVAWSLESGNASRGPREFPNVADLVPSRLENSEVFRASWARHTGSFLDRRIRSVIAIAPAPPVRAFDAATVRSIRIPVTLITGEADVEAPSSECADWLMRANPGFRRVSVGEHVGHYTFLGFPAGAITDDDAFIFQDSPGINRAEVHQRTADAVLAALEVAGNVADR